jgi:hypothetical protein
MSRPACRAILAHLVQDSAAMLPAGSTPGGTFENMRTDRGIMEDALHPVGFLGEPLDDHLIVLVAPPPHLRV